QTILCVLIDMAKPPTGKLSLFNLYVALSRKMFHEPHDEQLLMEDERLAKLDRETTEWW
ncbi:uncharacterized protein LAESUDRAFT_618925, partial [Laetiporus sulphureus 93-53]